MKEEQPKPEWSDLDSELGSPEQHSPMKSPSTKKPAAKKRSDVSHHCSQCGKAFLREETEFMPFCSRRCQQIDLGNWLGEAYGLPMEGPEEQDFGTIDEDDIND